MARKAKPISNATSTNPPITPSDNVDSTATAPLASLQEASTPVQATASNTTKKLVSKTRSTVDHATALLARVAEQQGMISRSPEDELVTTSV